MASVHRQMIFSNENADIQHKKSVAAIGRTKSSVIVPRKNGNRKALGDITNKAEVQPKASSKKKITEKKKEINVAEERFLHDHSKCLKEQQTLWDDHFSDLIVLRNDPSSKKEHLKGNMKKIDAKSSISCNDPEPEEMPSPNFSDWRKSSTPRRTPIRHDSLLLSPRPWGFDAMEFKLKEDEDF